MDDYICPKCGNFKLVLKEVHRHSSLLKCESRLCRYYGHRPNHVLIRDGILRGDEIIWGGGSLPGRRKGEG